jgi:hypothetical protein
MIRHAATVPCWHWSMSCRSSAPSAASRPYSSQGRDSLADVA